MLWIIFYIGVYLTTLIFLVAVKTQCQDINILVDKLVGDFRQEDKDSKYAREIHESELAAEKMHAEQKYMREHKDEHTAKELYMEDVQRQKERTSRRQSEEHKDESAALSVAMQERRDIQKRAQSKREMEAKDCDFAKQTVLDDLNSQQEMEDKCSNDEKVALAVWQCCNHNITWYFFLNLLPSFVHIPL